MGPKEKGKKKKKGGKLFCGNGIAEIEAKKSNLSVTDCYYWVKKVILVLGSNLNQ